jgi:hypothetical protein
MVSCSKRASLECNRGSIFPKRLEFQNAKTHFQTSLHPINQAAHEKFFCCTFCDHDGDTSVTAPATPAPLTTAPTASTTTTTTTTMSTLVQGGGGGCCSGMHHHHHHHHHSNQLPDNDDTTQAVLPEKKLPEKKTMII